MSKTYVAFTRRPPFDRIERVDDPMADSRRTDISDQLIQRVCGEFLEMPGLRLTCSQAQRLLGLDNQTCVRLLEFLVDAGFLYRPNGSYARRTDGHAEYPRPRMANAHIDDVLPQEAPAIRVTPVPSDRFSELEGMATQLSGSLGALEGDIRLAARVDVPVLITAEQREQRSLCARLIHASGGSVRGPFVTFSMSGVPSIADNANGSTPLHDIDYDLTLRHQFDQAWGGTLFVDDIGTLTTDAQAQLLTLLGEHVLPRSSAAAPGRRSVRVVAGANRHLDTERAKGAFCEPLFYRLNVIHLDFINHHRRSESPRRSVE